LTPIPFPFSHGLDPKPKYTTDRYQEKKKRRRKGDRLLFRRCSRPSAGAQRGVQAQGGRDSGLPVGCPEGLLSIHTGAQGGECMIDEWPEAGKSSLSPFPFKIFIMAPPCGQKGSLDLRDPFKESTLAYDKAAPVCRPGLTVPRTGLIPLEVMGLTAPCACASLFVMMSGSVILPQMRHFHPSYSQAQFPSKCMATFIPPHRSQFIGTSIGGSEYKGAPTGFLAIV
jgi:hypothetical protein